MQLLINSNKLEALLQRKQDYIGHKKLDQGCNIENLNEIEHPFSLVAIKDSFNKFSQRYLLYYDNRWKLNLFPNYRTQATEEENIANITKHLSNELQIPQEMIDVVRKGFELRTKYSVSDKVQKVYAHTLYQTTIKKFPKKMQAETFTIGDRQYSWWSIDSMEADASIKEHNLDVVELVKHNIV